MDVDKLFNLPKLSSSSLNKRKWSEPTAEALKAAKTSSTSTDASSALRDRDADGQQERLEPAGPSRPRATVADEGDDDNDQDAEFAPGNDANYFAEEDDEGGRFFGGGLSDQQKRILEIMNRGADDDEQRTLKPEVELANTRKQLLRFERAINKNQEMRVRFSDDPTKFIDSEADLDAELKGLVILTTNPGLFYPELVKIGSVTSMCGLLSHENVDISAAAIELIEELTDDDVLDAGEELRDDDDDDDEHEHEARAGAERKGQEGMRVLVDSLVDNQVLDLLVANLARFNDGPTSSDANREEVEGDMQGVYHTLGVLENLVSFRPELSAQLVQKTDYLKWTLDRISRKGPYDQNKGYAGELLAIVMQSNEENREKLGQMDGIDTLLSVLSQYRKRDPADDDETELMENLFDALCSCLSTTANKRRFLEGEGVELMVIIMKEKKLARLRSIKVLDHALQGAAGADNCERFVECLGLKTLFSAFMGKGSKKSSASSPTTEDTEHILSLLSSLFTNLASDSAHRIRLLSKFVEDSYAQTDRLLELRETFLARLEHVEAAIADEKRQLRDDEGVEIGDDEEEVFYLRRLESGLFCLQLVDYAVAWLCMEDDGVQAHIKMMLSRKGAGLQDVVAVLREYHANIGDDPPPKQGQDEPQEGEIRIKDILVALISFLEGCF
ncbi:uncharacterized protein PFL1_04175 [Pseudozyma flocculosa PF-1]|uniref:Related to nuclear associated protein n=2 Tax=Pseudozyma flocculosa TaxID=84751 RepID=A0A5C3EUG2_9BASI|nr:uncharacterized protein PFL1_04175 [Pseudozyma flocculosa PF-1]EPQ28348.1 hypothetical protein PFL1_04175 [Pseudozyma flocculosa PF-1]SPO35500.1 related to nuclear associated protein [Pseudozyma flocculosa]